MLGAKRVSIHPLERALVWTIGAHLVILPWALGAMRPWIQVTSFILAVISFSLALWPRNYTEEQTTQEPFRLLMWPKCLRFPIFWLGLVFSGLIVIQALNPAWQYQSDGKLFWMQSIPHRSWLPQGVSAPFAEWNQWRMLVIYDSAWLTVCAIWVGVTRQSSLMKLLQLLVANGALLAALGLLQRMFGNGKIFWLLSSPNPQFFSSFVYKNHAGAYLILVLAVTWGLAGWFYIRGLRRMDKSDPSVMMVFLTLMIAGSTFISQSRGATVVVLVFMTLMLIAFAVHQVRLPRENRRPLVSVLLLTILTLSAYPAMSALGAADTFVRLKRAVAREEPALQWREQVTKASIEMLGENWRKGVGSGAFRFIFPIYQHRHPELVTRFGQRLYWEHAHNDIVQFPIELGLFGTVVLLSGFLYFVIESIRRYFWDDPICFSLVTALMLLLCYAWWDFPFQNPAVLTTFLTLWTISIAYARTRTFSGE